MPPPDPTPDLRFVLANERTLLAWLRTGLGIMALGFVVARLGLWLRSLSQGEGDAGPSVGVGVALVLLGVVTLVVAAVRSARTHRALVSGRPVVPGLGAALSVTAALALAGVALALYLALR